MVKEFSRDLMDLGTKDNGNGVKGMDTVFELFQTRKLSMKETLLMVWRRGLEF